MTIFALRQRSVVIASGYRSQVCQRRSDSCTLCKVKRSAEAIGHDQGACRLILAPFSDP
eukprot:COSAG02_NODE_731_length_17977_cov_21.672838_12_plen_59_part_00